MSTTRTVAGVPVHVDADDQKRELILEFEDESGWHGEYPELHQIRLRPAHAAKLGLELVAEARSLMDLRDARRLAADVTTLWRLTTATDPWICASCLSSDVLADDIDEIPNHTDKEG